MNKVSLNDWQTMQARKEIEELHKKYSLSDTIDITVMMEVLLLVIGFFLDNVFENQAGSISQNAGEVGTTIWLVFAILSIFTVVVIWTIRFFYVRSKRALKKK